MFLLVGMLKVPPQRGKNVGVAISENLCFSVPSSALWQHIYKEHKPHSSSVSSVFLYYRKKCKKIKLLELICLHILNLPVQYLSQQRRTKKVTGLSLLKGIDLKVGYSLAEKENNAGKMEKICKTTKVNTKKRQVLTTSKS